MGSIEERHERASAGVALNHDPDAWYEGFARPRVVLQPIAAPSVLGLFGFAGATLIVASNLAGWWGSEASTAYLAPFAATFGGLAQFMAGMWSYRARDVLATAMHGMWGAFWIAYGILNILIATKALAAPTPSYHFPALGFWFLALGLITVSGTFAALAEGNYGVTAVLGTLAVASGIVAGGLIAGSKTWTETAGWVFVVSAVLAWYTATAMLLRTTHGRVVLPLGKAEHDANVPGGDPTRPIELKWGEPGVKMGQ